MMLRSILGIAAALTGFAVAQTQPVTVLSVLNESQDLRSLSRLPDPWFLTKQASSYDRASIDEATNWFANGDAGKFIREEQVDGRRERVMADLVGPGVLVRVWSANPAGVIRFYFDGEPTPRIEAPMAELLSEKGRFGEPYSYIASRGANLYFPIPYSKSLKVTAEATPEGGIDGLYYHFGYREYRRDTKVETFTWEAAEEAMRSPLVGLPRWMPQVRRTAHVQPGRALTVRLTGGPKQVDVLRVRVAGQAEDRANWTNPRAIHQLLRRARLLVSVDGLRTIDVPLGDFFGSAPGLNPYHSAPFTVSEDGWMESRLPMPFKSSLELTIRNDNPVALPLELEAREWPYPWDNLSLVLKAQWLADRLNTRPMRDMEFLWAAGPGVFVGSMLHVTNPPPAGWWGEGDEKMYLDGETFPSTFGTGTEDYYGYAWGNDQRFERPYHNQSRVDGPGLLGNTSLNRFHILDKMPFRRSFRFDMELWHWEVVDMSFSRIVWWYALPGQPGPKPVRTELLAPELILPKPPVEGAIEGETLKYRASGGVVEAQGGFAALSMGKQLWWKDAQPGATLEIEVPVKKAGTYRVSGNFCSAEDYGIHRIQLGDLDVTKDFFGMIRWDLTELGVTALKPGAVMKVTVVGKNPAAKPNYMFGLDYLLLDPVR